MRKGISGHTVVIVISLLIAVIGLFIFWFFLTNISETGKSFAEEMGRALCEAMKKIIVIPWLLNC